MVEVKKEKVKYWERVNQMVFFSLPFSLLWYHHHLCVVVCSFDKKLKVAIGGTRRNVHPKMMQWIEQVLNTID